MYDDYSSVAQISDPAMGMFTFVFFMLYLAIVWAYCIPMIIGMWQMFKKAGYEGWKSLIPIYNNYIMLKIVRRPAWWLILYLIPFVNIIVMIIVSINLSKAFGKDPVFAVGLILLPPVFYCILGFDKSVYTLKANNQDNFADRNYNNF